MVKPTGLITFGTIYLDNSRARIGPMGHSCNRFYTAPYTVHRAKHKISQRNVRWECYQYETVK